MASDKYSKKEKKQGKPDMNEIYEIRERLKKLLKPDRYEHSLSVSFTSVCLAMRYGADLRKAELAGLVHDCAKHFSKEELIQACKKDNVALTEEMLASPQVIHSVYGAVYARKLFNINDSEILSAVYYHTLGRPNMTLLEKIVFTADYIEARRFKADRLPEIRQLAFVDLDRAVYEIMHDTVSYLEANGDNVCSASLRTYAYYRDSAKKCS